VLKLHQELKCIIMSNINRVKEEYKSVFCIHFFITTHKNTCMYKCIKYKVSQTGYSEGYIEARCDIL